MSRPKSKCFLIVRESKARWLPGALLFDDNTVPIEFFQVLMASLLIFVLFIFDSWNHGPKQVFEVGVQPAIEDGVGDGAQHGPSVHTEEG